MRERSEFSGQWDESVPVVNGREDATVCAHGRYLALCVDCHPPHRRPDEHHIRDPWNRFETLCGRGAYEFTVHDVLDVSFDGSGVVRGRMLHGDRPPITCLECISFVTA